MPREAVEDFVLPGVLSFPYPKAVIATITIRNRRPEQAPPKVLSSDHDSSVKSIWVFHSPVHHFRGAIRLSIGAWEYYVGTICSRRLYSIPLYQYNRGKLIPSAAQTLQFLLMDSFIFQRLCFFYLGFKSFIFYGLKGLSATLCIGAGHLIGKL